MTELNGLRLPDPHSAGDDDGFMVDAKAEIAKALVLNVSAVTAEFASAAEYLRWMIGDDLAEPIIRRAMDYKIRQTRGGARVLVSALRSLALEEQRQISLIGGGGDGKR